MTHVRARVFAAAMALCLAQPAGGRAATLSGTDADFERTVQGYVDPGVYDAILKWLSANPARDLTLHLDSRGGLAAYGALLGNAIGKHGRVATDVGSGQSCLSACAFLWLAGRVRTIAERSELGFHSAFCTGPCDPHGAGIANQFILDILARTEPALAVLVSNTGVMITGHRRVALAHRENGHWVLRVYDPPE